MSEKTAGRKIAIVAYKPKPGMDKELLELTYQHVPLLREEGLATNHPVTVCRAADGTIIEVFEWEAGGIEAAHTNDAVNQMWFRYAACSTYVPLSRLAESSEMFAAFTTVV